MLFTHSRTPTSKHFPEYLPANTDIATEVGRCGARGETKVACYSSLSSPISQQFHVVHKLSPSRAHRTKVAELARHRRQRRPYGKGVTVSENGDDPGSYLAIV